MGPEGEDPKSLGNFLEKIALLMPFGLHFASFQTHLKHTKFLRFESQLKKSLPLLQILHFGG